MSRRKAPGVLITAVQTGWSEPSLTSRPSQRRKAKGAGIWPNTSRRTRAAPAGLGLGSAIIRVPPRSFYRGLADLVNPSRGAGTGPIGFAMSFEPFHRSPRSRGCGKQRPRYPVASDAQRTESTLGKAGSLVPRLARNVTQYRGQIHPLTPPRLRLHGARP